MSTKTLTLTSAIAVAAAVCFLGTAPAYAAPKGGGGKDVEATELNCEVACVGADEIEDDAVGSAAIGTDAVIP